MNGPEQLPAEEARRLADQMGVCICGRANQTYCDYGKRKDALAVPECARSGVGERRGA
jgi:hypothetical protein